MLYRVASLGVLTPAEETALRALSADRAEQVTQLYRQALERSPNAEELALQIASPLSWPQLIDAFKASPEHQMQLAAAQAQATTQYTPPSSTTFDLTTTAQSTQRPTSTGTPATVNLTLPSSSSSTQPAAERATATQPQWASWLQQPWYVYAAAVAAIYFARKRRR